MTLDFYRMIKVFEDFDISLVGHYQSVLESNDIATFMKNQFGTSGAGELPFVEVIPQLWVLNEADTERAKALIRELHDPISKEQPKEWICPGCGTQQEPAFTHCWQCSSARPARVAEI
jgi:rubrerythrin